MYQKIIGLLGVFLFLLSSLSAQELNSSKEYLARIDRMLEHNEFKKALKSLDEQIETNPQDIAALTKRADICVTMEREKEARIDLDAISAIDDQYCPSQLVHARLNYLNGDREKALFYINQGLSFDPDDNLAEDLYSLRGSILMSLDRYEDAESSLYKAAQSPKVSLQTMKNLATVLVENGKTDEAVMILKETIEIFGYHLESFINTGYVCNTIGLYDEAIYYLDEALKLEPDNPYALSNAALAYLHTGHLDIAYKLVERSIKNDNSNSFAYRVKGECLLAMGENTRSCRELKKAVQMGYTVLHEQTEITKLIIQSCGSR